MVPTPVGFGPELVVNGDFSINGLWNLSPEASISAGKLIFSGLGVGQANQTVLSITTADYFYAFDVIATDGTTPVTVYVGVSSLVVPGSDAVGHFSGIITCSVVDPSVALRAATGAMQLDNFSVKLVL
jgi:hypothetical protein